MVSEIFCVQRAEPILLGLVCLTMNMLYTAAQTSCLCFAPLVPSHIFRFVHPQVVIECRTGKFTETSHFAELSHHVSRIPLCTLVFMCSHHADTRMIWQLPLSLLRAGKDNPMVMPRRSALCAREPCFACQRMRLPTHMID
jgi:hypothetical protein